MKRGSLAITSGSVKEIWSWGISEIWKAGNLIVHTCRFQVSGVRFQVSGFNAVACLNSGPLNYHETVPIWRSFTSGFRYPTSGFIYLNNQSFKSRLNPALKSQNRSSCC